jgi:hypothetical protein
MPYADDGTVFKPSGIEKTRRIVPSFQPGKFAVPWRWERTVHVYPNAVALGLGAARIELRPRPSQARPNDLANSGNATLHSRSDHLCRDAFARCLGTIKHVSA